MKIQVKNLEKTIIFSNEEINILKNINMTVESGQFIAILGESGSGKSSLLNILSLLDNATSGKYMCEDKNVLEYSEKEKQDYIAQNIGIIFQQFNLIDSMNCYENIELALMVGDKVERKDRREIVEKYLQKMGLDHRKKHRIKTLSGGEQQRVAIARAIIREPQILLADEPTGNLDSENEKFVFETLRDYARKGNIVIAVSHSKNILEYVDRAFYLKKGELYEKH